MQHQFLVETCSATLAGLKTGNLVLCPMDDQKVLDEAVRRVNRQLAPRGLMLIPLRKRGDKALLYLVRPDRLKEDLSHHLAKKVLEAKEYPIEHPTLCIRELMRRINEDEEFPHEVGLFIGYPAEDVCGFMEKGISCAKCIGNWVVHGDEEGAKKRFAQLAKCRKLYMEQYEKNRDFERLIVKQLH